MLRHPIQPVLQPLLRPLMASGGGRTLIQRAISILRRYGQDAHVYMPGVGMLNGLQAGNYLDSAGTTVGTVDQPVGLVLDAVGSIHASQPTTASKPILRRGAVCLSQYSKDRTNASAWGGSGTTANTATSLTIPANSYSSQAVSANAGSAYTNAALLSGTPGSVVNIYLQDGDGAFASAGVDVTLTATPTLYAFSRTTTGSVTFFGIRYSSGATTTINVAAQGLFQGIYTAAQIQALGGIPLTTTAPASTALGPHYFQFDGSNDSLSLGGPLFQAGDNCAVICGVNLNGEATFSAVVVPSGNAGSLAQVASIWKTNTNRLFGLWRDDAGVEVGAYGTTSVAGMTVVAATRTQSGVGLLRINGVQAASSTPPVGVTTLNSGAIGNRPGGASPTNGNIYPVIAIKGTVTDPDLLLLEKFVANLSGVTL